MAGVLVIYKTIRVSHQNKIRRFRVSDFQVLNTIKIVIVGAFTFVEKLIIWGIKFFLNIQNDTPAMERSVSPKKPSIFISLLEILPCKKLSFLEMQANLAMFKHTWVHEALLTVNIVM